VDKLLGFITETLFYGYEIDSEVIRGELVDLVHVAKDSAINKVRSTWERRTTGWSLVFSEYVEDTTVFNKERLARLVQ
jgi:hypothetical protein